MAPLLIVFTKAPVRGGVKTRLTPVLSPERACQLHSAMVTDLLSRLQQMRPQIDLELHTDAPTSAWTGQGIRQDLQSTGSLGERMYFAMRRALESSRPAVLVLGSDSPTVPLTHLLELLDTAKDVALGPATDGGFYAISCRRVHPQMFHGVTWSSSTACKDTIEASQRCGLSITLGPPWYDVDSPDDLRQLLLDSNLGPATRAALENSAH